MISEKFGLDELQRYVDEVGLSRFRGDVRTIRGILVVVGIPNTIVEEGTEVIAACQGLVATSEDAIVDIKQTDEVSAKLMAEQMARLAAARREAKVVNDNAVKEEKAGISLQNAEVARLTKLLSKFA